MVGADGQENVPHRDWLLMFDRVQNEVKADMKRQGREDEFVGARVNHPIMKSQPQANVSYLSDNILHDPIHHARRTRMVHGRLYCVEKRISSYNCRSVFTLLPRLILSDLPLVRL